MTAYKAQFKNYVYIGITGNFNKRRREHRCQFKKNISPFNGIAPSFESIDFEIIEHDDSVTSGSIETVAICAFKAMGFDVLNKKRGADGITKANKYSHPEAKKIGRLKRIEKISKESLSNAGKLGSLMRMKNRGDYVAYLNNVEVFRTFDVSEMAKFIGVNNSSVCRYINGARKHSKYTLTREKIAGGGL